MFFGTNASNSDPLIAFLYTEIEVSPVCDYTGL
jgi:hypothetical protein